jgi:GAF domain-containing protein
MTSQEGTDRLRVLVETGIAINSELSLDGVLERIVEAAARVTDARYAALGVIDPAGTGLERFVTFGMTWRRNARSAHPERSQPSSPQPFGTPRLGGLS